MEMVNSQTVFAEPTLCANFPEKRKKLGPLERVSYATPRYVGKACLRLEVNNLRFW